MAPPLIDAIAETIGHLRDTHPRIAAVGGGFIVNGQLLRGARSVAGELGQTSIDYQGRKGAYENLGAPFKDQLRIVPAKFGNEAGMLGSARLALEEAGLIGHLECGGSNHRVTAESKRSCNQSLPPHSKTSSTFPRTSANSSSDNTGTGPSPVSSSNSTQVRHPP